ncbi:hypothetical protein HYT55_00480 [Candidatus Woesearchaeota archaeon]|nr:hypothetical protein [Candidatus Woesearchaeota archaeon]
MQREKAIFIVAVVLGILSSMLVFGADTEIPDSICSVSEDCIVDTAAADFCSNEECYCSEETYTCFISEEIADTQSTQNVTDVSTAPSITTQAIEEKLNLLQLQSASVEDRVANLEQVILLIQQQITTLGQKVDSISSQQVQSKEAIQKDVTAVATGLAGLQTDVGAAKKDLQTVEDDVAKIQRFKLIVTILGLILLSGAFFLGLQYYLKIKKADPRLVQYIVKQAKQGQRFAQVHQTLLRAGWAEDDIKQAYRQATKGSAQGGTATGQAGPAGVDSKKVMLLAGFALFFVVGIILVLKGVTTGHAIYFKDAGELSSAMKENIEKNLENNQFYGLAKQFDLCVEVEEADNAASYRVTKTKNGNTVKEAALNCDNTDKYGFAVKFKSWEAFDLVSNDLSCTNIKAVHTKKQMYVLPSKFIEAGFAVDPTMDISSFCELLAKCMTAKQIEDAGIEC